jgi:hypothetical protein
MDNKTRVSLTRVLTPDYHHYRQVFFVLYFKNRNVQTTNRFPNTLYLNNFRFLPPLRALDLLQVQVHVTKRVRNSIATEHFISTLLKSVIKTQLHELYAR